jgi:hypothetical protein
MRLLTGWEKPLEKVPDAVTKAFDMLVRTSVHLAGLLNERPYPGEDE